MDNYLTIKRISLNWNNQAGLLSSMSPEQLYRNSLISGLGNMTWDEFCGQTISVAGSDSKNRTEARHWVSGVGARSITNATGVVQDGNPGFKVVPTTGSVLVLEFGSVIQLTEEYYAPGSLGTFNLQLQLDVVNNQAFQWNAGTYEMVIMPMLSGVFVNERGTSSTFISLLTKEDFIQASQQEPYTKYEIKRMIGGSFMDSIKSGLGWLNSKIPMVKNVLNNIPHAYAQTGAKVLGALGYGKGDRGTLADRLM